MFKSSSAGDPVVVKATGSCNTTPCVVRRARSRSQRRRLRGHGRTVIVVGIEFAANFNAAGKWHASGRDCRAHVWLPGVGMETPSGPPSDCLRIVTYGNRPPWYIRSSYPVS